MQLHPSAHTSALTLLNNLLIFPSNCEFAIRTNIVTDILEIFQSSTHDAITLREACKVLTKLSADTDIQTPFSKFESTERGLLQCLKQFKSDPDFVLACFQLLYALVFNNEQLANELMVVEGYSGGIVQALDLHQTQVPVVEAAFRLIREASMCTPASHALKRAGVMPLVRKAVNNFSAVSPVIRLIGAELSD
eukprot:TRINITY_DN4179_c0_g1_i2.p1 TRINITY_DN4179_c0_g1~~TRINITY_DN4179_c0_g1_i2.p1  ORF type:complete len:193 (+),score=19.72 TRINITY_DN4179_c0_g1_i2:390-968(+)